MKYNLFLISCFLFLSGAINGQDFRNIERCVDSNYVDYVQSVKVFPSGYPLGRPIIDINSTLDLKFDVIGDNNYYYNYSFIHCDKNWVPTDLPRQELIQGFETDRLENFEFSIGTYQNYINYTQRFPTPDMKWKASGNYLLIVFLQDPVEIVFTRRFIVSEDLLKSSARGRKTSFSGSYQTHQTIDFESTIPTDLRLANPETNVSLSIYQNMEEEPIGPVQPRSSFSQTIRWNYIDKFAFPGLKEWRLNDIRSFDYLRLGMDQVSDNSDTIFVVRKMDKPRTSRTRDTKFDLNGGWAIAMDEQFDPATKGDYALVTFRLKADIPYERDVYVVGGFSQYKCLEEYRMNYYPNRRIYEKDIYLKQGVYDYMYAVEGDMGYPDYSVIEGSEFTSFNQYYGVIYYKAFNGRYDRVIGSLCFRHQCENVNQEACGCR